ncbi:hypothetical protein BJ742DRAFT_821336 [Cladochytrium replicatum]|nr:hypothetical protein BJ742DRAFT_821336 [Cladochytrium replicatum]
MSLLKSWQQFSRADAPERGSFPLDVQGKCKQAAQAYFACLKQNATDHAPCKEFSKAYLACRMDRGLMDKEDFSRIGYGDDGKLAASGDKPS